MKDKKKLGAAGVVGIIICVILTLILINNIIIITKGQLNPDRPASSFGFTPMIVTTGSMEKAIMMNDLIVVKNVDPSTLKEQDIITFMEDEDTVVTHRIMSINEDGSYVTKGDNNNIEDQNPVNKDQVIGKYIFRIPKLGALAMFMQSPLGMLIFIGIPVILYFLLDALAKSKSKKKKESDSESEKAAMEEELKKLREMVNEKDDSSESDN